MPFNYERSNHFSISFPEKIYMEKKPFFPAREKKLVILLLPDLKPVWEL